MMSRLHMLVTASRLFSPHKALRSDRTLGFTRAFVLPHCAISGKICPRQSPRFPSPDPPSYFSAVNIRRRRPRSLLTSRSSSSSSNTSDSTGRGLVEIEDERDASQRSRHPISVSHLKDTIRRTRHLLSYPTFDVNLFLVDDAAMAEINLESRDIDGPTDVLSFPFEEAEEPGLLPPPPFDLPDYYCLGDLFVDVPYVARRVEEDRGLLKGETDMQARGVSRAMSNEFNLERRIQMLLVHGMLHLVGYDHIEDVDYELMVGKEEEILRELGLWKESI